MFESVKEELSSGKYSLYAQYMSVISLLLLVFMPFLYISHAGLLFIWSIVSWVIAGFITLIEFPIFARCIPADGPVERFFKSTKFYAFRTGSYGM